MKCCVELSNPRALTRKVSMEMQTERKKKDQDSYKDLKEHGVEQKDKQEQDEREEREEK